jgi:uncharacterized protein YbaA (DUF1428 family)
MRCVDGYVSLNYPPLAKMMDPKSMPFDPKRMVYGGFKVVVDG